jgi:hypothetical protein
MISNKEAKLLLLINKFAALFNGNTEKKLTVLKSRFFSLWRLVTLEKIFLGTRIGEEKGLLSEERQHLRLHYFHKL